MNPTTDIVLDNVYVIDFFKKNFMLDKNVFIEHLLREYQKTNSSEKVEISTQEIISIRNEYHQLLALKKSCLHIVTELRQINLPTLNEFCEKYETIHTPRLQNMAPEIVCDLCHTFISHTRKGIATHKTTCRRNIEKMAFENTSPVENSDIENVDVQEIHIEKMVTENAED